MNEPDLKLNAKINGKEAELSINPADLDELYSQLIEYRQSYELARAENIVREAAQIAIEVGKISTSLLQRRLLIGYGRAASIIDKLEEIGVIGPNKHGNEPREVLIKDIKEFDNKTSNQEKDS